LDVGLAVVLHRAAGVLNVEGQRAISASVFGVGSRLLVTADAIRRSANLLATRVRTAPNSDDRVITEARENLQAVAGFLLWERERLSSYCTALGAALNAQYDRDHDVQSAALENTQRWLE
jgi:hypothetical protein